MSDPGYFHYTGPMPAGWNQYYWRYITGPARAYHAPWNPRLLGYLRAASSRGRGYRRYRRFGGRRRYSRRYRRY